ncbi:Hypothetical_protein [Hexamita inflata]|uniref:Hypothetical_protein n=1 Tax=Hexamita inflata TaxID=28002 RepID=A0ABP1HR84_9EUKA
MQKRKRSDLCCWLRGSGRSCGLLRQQLEFSRLKRSSRIQRDLFTLSKLLIVNQKECLYIIQQTTQYLIQPLQTTLTMTMCQYMFPKKLSAVNSTSQLEQPLRSNIQRLSLWRAKIQISKGRITN